MSDSLETSTPSNMRLNCLPLLPSADTHQCTWWEKNSPSQVPRRRREASQNFHLWALPDTQLTPTINCPNSKQGEWLSERKTPLRDLSGPWNINLHLWDATHCGVLQCTALNHNVVVIQKPWALSALKTQYKTHVGATIVIYVDAALPGSPNPHSSCLRKEPPLFISELWVETEPSP